MIRRQVKSKPPRVGEWLLKRLLLQEERYEKLGDFEEGFHIQSAESGSIYAWVWYWFQIIIVIPTFLSNLTYWSTIMVKSYLKIAFRNIRKYKAYSFINIAGLAIGMAVCILILLWIQDELSYDRFHVNSNELYRIVEQQTYAGGQLFPVAVTPAPLAEALKEELPEIVNSMRYATGLRLLVRQRDIRFYEENVVLADPSIFEMFTFPFIKGDPASALNNLGSIVITEEMALKYFGDEDPVGQSFKIENQFDMIVTGVVENVPHNSHLKFDFIVPFLILQTVGQPMDQWDNNAYFTYVQLSENASTNDVDEKIRGTIKKHVPESVTTLHLQALTRIHLHSDYAADMGGHGDIKYVYIFSIIAAFVLFIACINFINLSTARSGNRAKEVGMRKVSGALRTDIIKQFFGESILMTLIAFLSGLFIVFLFLPAFNNLSGKSLALDITRDITIPLGLLATAIFTGILSGSYPALFLSSFRPVKVLKGMLKTGSKSSNFRRVLVVIQFSLSIFLIISTTLIHDQLDYIRNRKLGFDMEHIVYIQLGSSPRYYDTLKNELLKNSSILGVTSASGLLTSMMNSTSGVDWPGKNPDDAILMHNMTVGHDFFEVFQMEMVEGRTFSKAFPTDSVAYIVNEKVVEVMEMDSPLGSQFTLWDDMGPIIGVVKEFHFKSLNTEVEPLVMRLRRPEDFHYLFIRIGSRNVSGLLNTIQEIWDGVAPEFPCEIRFLDEDFDRLYRAEARMGTLFNYFTILAIFIACLGLLGLASFMAEQRTKEMGIRKVLGASSANIVMLLSREFIVLVSLANIIAWPLAYYFMNRWLQNYAYHASINFFLFLISAVAAVVIALVTVSVQAFKAALVNPADSLKYE